MSSIKCQRCGRSDYLTSSPTGLRGSEIILCADCCDDYDKAYEKFLQHFIKSKPISHKINDLFKGNLK